MTADDDVVAAAKRGDAEAWRVLYRAHAHRLLLWLGTRPVGQESVDDIAAAAWLVAAERIADFEGDSSDFAGWLFGIARHHLANAGRRAARRERAVLDTGDPVVPGPEPETVGTDWARQVLAGLPERERDVVLFRTVLDLDVAATAAALGISAVAVRVAHHRGLRRLRGALESPPTDPR